MNAPPVVAITRPEHDAVRTASFLGQHGFRCLVQPLLETRPIAPAARDVRALLACDWALVTSRNAATALAALLASEYGSGREKPPFAIAAIHEGSAAALAESGIPANRILLAPNAHAAAQTLVRELPQRPLHIGYACSLQAEAAWVNDDTMNEAVIVRVPLYSTDAVHDADDLDARACWGNEAFDCVLLASPTAARALQIIRPLSAFSPGVAFAAIGRTTARCLEELGRPPDIVPAEPTLPALAEALIHWRDARRTS